MSDLCAIALVSAGVGIAVPLLVFWLLALFSGPNIVVVPKQTTENTST